MRKFWKAHRGRLFYHVAYTYVAELPRRIERLEAELGDTHKVVQRLQGELGTSTARLEATSNDNSKLVDEQEALRERIRELDVVLNEARRETDARAKE